MSRAGGIFRWSPKFSAGTALRQDWITMRMPQRSRRAYGARAVVTVTFSMRAWALESVLALFWTGKFFMDVPGLQLKAVTYPLITAVLRAIAGRKGVSRHSHRGRRSRVVAARW